MGLIRKMKENARKSLTNRWGKAISILMFAVGVQLLFICMENLTTILCNKTAMEPLLQIDLFTWQLRLSPLMYLLTGIFGLLSFLVFTPLWIGMKKWYYRLIQGERPNIVTIFEFFLNGKTYFRSLFLQILVSFFKLVAGALFSLPSIGITAAILYLDGFSSGGAQMAVLGLTTLLVIVTGAMWVLYLFYVQRYFLAEYLFISDEKLSAWRAVRGSVKLMRGERRKVLFMQLSFLPWFLLCVLLVPALFVVPYFYSSLAINAHYLIEKKGEVQKQPIVEE